MSRQKGNRFEREMAVRLLAADGADPIAAGLQSSAGRIGHLDLGADVVSRRFAYEMKNRQSIGVYFWEWLGHLAERVAWREHIPVLVVKRNHREPLVVMYLTDFEALIREENDGE